MNGHRHNPSGGGEAAVSPKKLELTLNPEDGSLQTVSLYQVILATTDALYSDLYNMAHGELDVYSTTTTAATTAAKPPPPPASPPPN